MPDGEFACVGLGAERVLTVPDDLTGAARGPRRRIETDGVAASWGFGAELHAHLASEISDRVLDETGIEQARARIAALEKPVGHRGRLS